MTDHANPEDISTITSEIEQFIGNAERPVLIENAIELFDLSSVKWKISTEFRKLVFEVWNQSHTLMRRVEGVAYHDHKSLGLFVRKPYAGKSDVIEIRDIASSVQIKAKGYNRSHFTRKLLEMLEREWPGWKFESISHQSDREKSFSAWYTRGLARKGTQCWAFLGLNATELPAAADSLLAFALLWLDSLRQRTRGIIVGALRLFVPTTTIDLNAYRTMYLNSRVVHVELLRWQLGDRRPEPDSFERKQLWEVSLAPCGRGRPQHERHRQTLRDLLGDLADQVYIVRDANGKSLSIRFAGLELVRIEGNLAPRVLFGLEGEVRQLDRTGPEALREFVRSAVNRRRAENPNKMDELYKLQAERWLESIVISDVTRIDPALDPRFVYSQVPAFSDVNRGVIDILGIRSDRRLAVIELKLSEEINLPFQALDYWIAVKELAARKKFQDSGYFKDFAPNDAPPVLYLVAPAFRFHSSTDILLRYFDPSIEIQLVGINAGWRKGLKVLFRRSPRGRAH